LLDCPMWIPDSLNTDSLGFFQRVIGNIKDYLEKKGEDSIITKYPGAEK